MTPRSPSALSIKTLRQRVVLNPDEAAEYVALGNFRDSGWANESRIWAQSRAALLENNFAAYGNLAHLFFLENRFSEAVQASQRAILIDCGASAAYWLLARAWHRLGRGEFARLALERSLQIDPLRKDSVALRATIAFEAGQYSFAASQFSVLHQSFRDDDEVLSNLGGALSALKDSAGAQHCFNRALSLRPESILANLNSGTHALWYGTTTDAFRNLNRTLILDRNHTKAKWNLSLVYFLLGRFDLAWPLHESRFAAKKVDIEVFGLPWNSSAQRSRCLVWGEQGVGDEVMFGSMLGEFRGMVGKLLVQLDRRLIPLFRRSLPEDVEFFERGTVVPEDRYDSHIAIGSLGQYLRPSLESFAGKGGKYLWADPGRVQAMREWLSVREGERVIGLSWRSSNPETGAARSLALSDLVKSLQAPGVRFVNLQYGDVAAEIEALERDAGIEVLQCPGLDTTDDLDGLAALIEACDEVVSIGNATAHLAGALGKKTTVLLPKAPSWRWLAEGEVSPWYREMSLRRNADMSPWADFLVATFVVRGRSR